MRAALLRAEHAAVAVETALAATFILIPLLLGLADLAQLAIGKAQLDEALQDALTYIAATNATGSAQITSAAQAAYGSSIGVASSQVCYCVNTATKPIMPSSVACGGSCPSGSTMAQFEQVTVSETLTLLFNVRYLGDSTTISSTGAVQTGP